MRLQPAKKITSIAMTSYRQETENQSPFKHRKAESRARNGSNNLILISFKTWKRISKMAHYHGQYYRIIILVLLFNVIVQKSKLQENIT